MPAQARPYSSFSSFGDQAFEQGGIYQPKPASSQNKGFGSLEEVIKNGGSSSLQETQPSQPQTKIAQTLIIGEVKEVVFNDPEKIKRKSILESIGLREYTEADLQKDTTTAPDNLRVQSSEANQFFLKEIYGINTQPKIQEVKQEPIRVEESQDQKLKSNDIDFKGMFASKAKSASKDILKGLFSFTVDVFIVIVNFNWLKKDIFFSTKKKSPEQERMEKEQAANKRTFFEGMKNDRLVHEAQKRKELDLEQEKLGLPAMGAEQANTLLGENRNKLFGLFRSKYHFMESSLAMQRQKEEEEKAKKQESAPVPPGKGKSAPGNSMFNLNKVAEGGTVISNTGGGGIG